MPDRANITTFVACERVIEEKGTGKKSVIGIFQNLSLRSLPSRLGGPWYVFAQLFGLDEEKVDITVNIVHDETQGVVFAAGLEMKQAHSTRTWCLMCPWLDKRLGGKTDGDNDTRTRDYTQGARTRRDISTADCRSV